MLSELDSSVGQVVDALKNAGMLEDSIIIFSTDNGGPADGFNLNAASNWPLRGVKNTLWEGGVRGAGNNSSRFDSENKNKKLQEFGRENSLSSFNISSYTFLHTFENLRSA